MFSKRDGGVKVPSTKVSVVQWLEDDSKQDYRSKMPPETNLMG